MQVASCSTAAWRIAAARDEFEFANSDPPIVTDLRPSPIGQMPIRTRLPITDLRSDFPDWRDSPSGSKTSHTESIQIDASDGQNFSTADEAVVSGLHPCVELVG